MLKLSKRVEYALLAMQRMAARPGAAVSAKDIALQFNISHTLLAKVLQDLVRAGHIRSERGVNGGYALAANPRSISIADVIEAIEGRVGGIVQCQETGHSECDTAGCCTIRGPLDILHHRISSAFASMTINELVQPQPSIILELP